MNSHYYEIYIIPTAYFDIFCDCVLEITQEAIEQSEIPFQCLQHRNLQSSTKQKSKHLAESKTPLNTHLIKSKKHKWNLYNTDFVDVKCFDNSSLKEGDTKTAQAIIVRTQSNPSDLLATLKDFAKVLSKRVSKKVGFAWSSKKCKNIDWIESYKIGLKPIRCARFYIRPSWCEPYQTKKNQHLKKHKAKTDKSILNHNLDNKNSLIDIIIDPSLAFGSGHHASTFLCLEMLHRIDTEINLHNRHCLDLGCGSGILGIAMAKMGAKVDVCDIDEYAIEQTSKNFAQNGVTFCASYNNTLDKLLHLHSATPNKHTLNKESNSFKTNKISNNNVSKMPNTHITKGYDIICANILADVLLPLRDDFIRALARNANVVSKDKGVSLLILSGIVETKAEALISHFCKQDSAFKLLEKNHKDEWVCLKFALLA